MNGDDSDLVRILWHGSRDTLHFAWIQEQQYLHVQRNVRVLSVLKSDGHMV
jgi:hypothetical protein